jgi:hypothetical protein
MTELRHFQENLVALDREIIRAAQCAFIDPTDERVMSKLLADREGSAVTPAQRARLRLRGLILLKHKVAIDALLSHVDRLTRAV